MKSFTQLLHHHRFRLLIILFLFLAVDLGMLIVVFEVPDIGSNIKTLEDGIWWAVTTMTGVGYGDVYPVTTLGRVVGILLEVLGVVVFGLIVGYIAVAIFSVKDQYYWRKLDKRLDEIEKKLDRLSKGQGYLVKNGSSKKKSK